MIRDGISRREFCAAAGMAAGAAILPSCATFRRDDSDSGAALPFEISLAEWSHHRAIRAGEFTNLDFPRIARERYGIAAVEYVNQFFMDEKGDDAYFRELAKRCQDLGVKSLLIMCDGEGALGDPDDAKRAQAIENHRGWIDAAVILGCHSIRVNADTGGVGTTEEQQERAADGLRRLTELSAQANIRTIVENHGGLSSNGAWLAGVMKLVDHPRCGTLPDFGNFQIREGEWYDRYQGVAELMPFAKAVSAKSHDFDDKGNEIHTDYARMMAIVIDAGYRGHVGIEYEGEKHSEEEGIRLTKALLERVRAELSAPPAA
jgi:sugar phosphate isomerase/epimerase